MFYNIFFGYRCGVDYAHFVQTPAALCKMFIFSEASRKMHKVQKFMNKCTTCNNCPQRPQLVLAELTATKKK